MWFTKAWFTFLCGWTGFSMVYCVKFDHLWTSYLRLFLDVWAYFCFYFVLFLSLMLSHKLNRDRGWPRMREGGNIMRNRGISLRITLRKRMTVSKKKESMSNQITHLAAILDQTAAVLAFWDHTTWTQTNLVFYKTDLPNLIIHFWPFIFNYIFVYLLIICNAAV